MSNFVEAQPNSAISTPNATRLLQRACACGSHSGGGECASCRAKRERTLQRAAVGAGPATAPPIVQDALRSPGQPLDPSTRAWIEPRFGHDFSRVPATAPQRAPAAAAPATPDFQAAIRHTNLAPMLQRAGDSANPPAYPSQPPQSGARSSAAPVRGMKTSCDVKVDPRDQTNFLLKKSFRTVGVGQPQIGTLFPGMEKQYPCLAEAGKAHEEQHVKNSLQACQAFKKCVDDHSWRFLYIGDPTISYGDFAECYQTNSGGKMADCIADERSAYETSIKKAQALMAEARCAGEKDVLQQNITYWESIKDHDPDCDTAKK